MTSVVNLRVNAQHEPLAISGRPRFSWQLRGDRRNTVQRSYRVTVARVLPDHTETALWDSGTYTSTSSTDNSMPAGLLQPGSRYAWTVEVATDLTEDMPEIAGSTFETAVGDDVWRDADWITLRRDDFQNDDNRPIPYLRKQVTPRGAVAVARLHATAGGIYEAWISGEKLGASSLAPGWTDYDQRVAFHTFDVTSLIKAGEPTYLGAVVADGWYSGGVGPFHRREFWGKRPVFRAVLILDYEDGTREVISTGADWEGSFGAIRSADLLQGQVIDARQELRGWSTGEHVTGWRAVDVQAGPTGRLVAGQIEPVRPIHEFPALSRTEPLAGGFVYDFGQNFAGHIRLTARGPAGTIVRVRHGEVLDDDGSLYVANLRGARATDTFILSGGDDVFEPRFTYHGFRYVEVTGIPGAAELEDIVGVAVSSATRDTGTLHTDNGLINQLVSNTRWSMRSNFVDVPTDCPSRDERAGWTGDGQVFAGAASWLADVQGFFAKWTDDILDAALPSGAITDIAPAKGLIGRLSYTEDGSSGYAESILVVPWVVYERYGDSSLIEAAYDAAARWVEYVTSRTNDLVWRANRNTDYGDWLAPVETPKDLTATAYFNLAIWLMVRFSEVLGREKEALKYSRLFEKASAQFRRAFVNHDGTMPAGTQAAYTLALAFDLLLPQQRVVAAEALAADIEERGHLTAGFLSISRLLPVLTDIGRSDLAYMLVLREEYPSWGHEIAHGATTIWERWDGWRDGIGFQDPLMNSFNHYAFGSVTEWLFSALGGLSPSSPGFATARIAPQLHPAVTRAALNFESVRGPISVSWSVSGRHFECSIVIPPNVTADVELPATSLGEGELPLSEVAGVAGVASDAAGTSFKLGSGSYSFRGDLANGVTS